jgi:hypothetical protein
VKRLIELHHFFCRQSQHYVLGNWYEYVTDKAKRRKYVRQFPLAYLRFMWFSLRHHS